MKCINLGRGLWVGGIIIIIPATMDFRGFVVLVEGDGGRRVTENKHLA